jgi:hypothetical protein
MQKFHGASLRVRSFAAFPGGSKKSCRAYAGGTPVKSEASQNEIAKKDERNRNQPGGIHHENRRR